jgi:hypothetical protein
MYIGRTQPYHKHKNRIYKSRIWCVEMYNRMFKYDEKMVARFEQLVLKIMDNLDMRHSEATAIYRELLDVFEKTKENNYRNGYMDGKSDTNKRN